MTPLLAWRTARLAGRGMVTTLAAIGAVCVQAAALVMDRPATAAPPPPVRARTQVD